jgi:hypothetical protein
MITVGSSVYLSCACGALLVAWKLLRREWTNFVRKAELTRARETVEHFKRITRPRGVARPLTPFLLLCLTAPSVGAGFVAGYYAREMKQAKLEEQKARAEAESARKRLANTETYTWFKVLDVYDHWGFKVQFLAGGAPFDMKFLHDGSDLKLGWDPGMIVESCTFLKTFDGLTVADDDLGMTVWRYPNSHEFVDYRKVNYNELLASNRAGQ